MITMIILAVLAIYFLGAPRFMQPLYSKLLFMPHKEQGDGEAFLAEFGSHAQFVQFNSGKFQLRGCFYSCPDTEHIVLVSLGRDGDIPRRLELLRVLRDSRINVFIYEYPGFGKSTGHATIQTVLDSGIAAVEYVVGKLGFKPDKIILFGESMGVCTALQQASAYDFAGVILKSGFYSLERVSKERFPILRIYPAMFYPELMNNAVILKSLTCPLLIIHGAKDRMVNIRQAHDLAKLNPCLHA